ncbi:hypothetical protein D3C72_2286090 [compost metagenome]
MTITFLLSVGIAVTTQGCDGRSVIIVLTVKVVQQINRFGFSRTQSAGSRDAEADASFVQG